MARHPIFNEFTGYTGFVPGGMIVDWIGARFLPAWTDAAANPEGWITDPTLPFAEEEEFEWIDLLEAVKAAKDRFVMLELGAGFGRWGIRAALAAKQMRIPDIEIHFVEGELQNAAWIREAIKLNSLDDIKTTVVEAAIAYSGEPVPFTVGWPEEGYVAKNWYGQTISIREVGPETGEAYFGRPVHRVPGGYAQIYVDTMTLEGLINGLDRVDYIDADLQGAEKDLVLNAIETLNAKVKRIYLGTHSNEIEDAIRQVFTDAGWKPIWDFTLQKQQMTPFGEVNFGDGVQAWVNPTL